MIPSKETKRGLETMTDSMTPQKSEKRNRSLTQQASNKVRRSKKRSPRSQQPQAFRFLDLPAELRNNIYEKVAEDETAYLKKNTRGNLACASGLSCLNSQVRSEFLAILILVAPQIVTLVTNWDFSHVVRYLNKLSDAELNALPTVKTPSARSMDIQLRVTHEPRFNIDFLTRWLNRMSHPTKKGTDLGVRYTVVDSIDFSKFGGFPVRRKGSVKHISAWAELLEHKAKAVGSGRTADEAKNIVQALRDYVLKFQRM